MSNGQSEDKGVRVSPALSYFPIYAHQEILQRMRLLRHGGTLIIVPDEVSWKKSVERPMTYACELSLNQVLPIFKYIKGQVGKIEAEDTADQYSKDTKSMELWSDYRLRTFLWNASRSVAYLSAVDGAVLLNRDLSVISFGTKLRKSRSGARAKSVVSIPALENEGDPGELPLEHIFRGTRHLSAAQFVFDNPGAIAFVVSQDGAITGFKMRNPDSAEAEPKLLAYRNLELLL
jgi:hypothetical protein